MGLTEVDHVAIAVRDLDAAVAWYADAFGATVAHREVVERDGVEEALLAVADSYIQLLTPIRDDSTGRQVPRDQGEGLHHVGYRVADCAAALQQAVAAGARPIDAEPRPGFARDHGGVSPPEDRLRHADRAGPGMNPTQTGAGASATHRPRGCPQVQRPVLVRQRPQVQALPPRRPRAGSCPGRVSPMRDVPDHIVPAELLPHRRSRSAGTSPWSSRRT